MDNPADGLDTLRPEEKRAAEAVASLVGAEASANDTGGKQGAFDVLLTYLDGRTAALEVTSFAAKERHRLRNQLHHDYLYELPNPGNWYWSISFSHPDDLKPLEQRYEALILACERNSVQVPYYLPPGECPEELEWLVHKTRGQIEFVGYPTEIHRNVHLSEVAHGGAVDTHLSSLDDEVQKLFEQDSVAKRVSKVIKAPTDECHLYIGMDLTGLPGGLAMALWGSVEAPSTSHLNPPDGLTHLWLAPATLRGLLGWTRTTGWTFHPDAEIQRN